MISNVSIGPDFFSFRGPYGEDYPGYLRWKRQYSPLWRIRTQDAAPLEIIVRYKMSEAVDGICTLPLR
jgi:hypothetical protein